MMKWGVLMKDDIKLQHITSKQVEIQVQDVLHRLLDSIPLFKDVNIFSSQSNHYDIEAICTTEMGNQVVFQCEVKNSGEPKYIRNAVQQLTKYREYARKISRQHLYFMVAAPYISLQSSKICEEHGIGYIDLSGNCLIIYEGIYVRVEGKPNKYKEMRKTKSIFERSAVKSSVILRTILYEMNRPWRVQDLAVASSTSIGQVSNVKKFLEEREYIIIGKQGFCVTQPKDLLGNWAKEYHSKPNTVVECYSLDPIPQFERKLADMREKKGIEYALTGFSGGVRYSPTVRYNKVHVYIELQDLQESINYLGLKKVDSGSNISIIIPYDPCVLLGIREFRGDSVASPTQVCLELLGLKGRGEEAAWAVLEGEALK